MEQLKVTVEALQKENAELLQKLHNSEEGFRSVSEEKDNLKIMLEALEMERNTTSQSMYRLYETIEKTVAANLELQEQLRNATSSPKEYRARLQELGEKASEKGDQVVPDVAVDELKQKIEQLTEERNAQISEKYRLVAEQKEKVATIQQLVAENAWLRKVMDDYRWTVESIRIENDVLRCNLTELVEKEIASKLPLMEKRKEYLGGIAIGLKRELDNVKTVVVKGLPVLSRGQAAHVEKLQRQHEKLTDDLYCLLNDLKFFFTSWYQESRNYYANVSMYTTSLLQENLKHLRILTQIQILKKVGKYGDEYKQLTFPALRRKMDIFLERIMADLAKLEEELISVEDKAQQLESDGKEVKQYLERCSVRFSVQDFEEGIEQDVERLWHVHAVLKPKAQALSKARSEVAMRHASYCKEAEAALRLCRERGEQWLRELNSLKELPPMPAEPNVEEKKLGNNLKAIEQHMKAQLDKDAEIDKEEIEDLTAQLAKADMA